VFHDRFTAVLCAALTVGGSTDTHEEGPSLRLLADRGSDGISVRLFWDEASNAESDIVLEYEDIGEGVAYMVRPPRNRALDAFYHPNAYLALERRAS
jgi:hypothetical protein